MKCPNCQIELTNTANFCFKCGQELSAIHKASSSRSIHKPERRRITSLFSDLSGYTTIAEQLDPEQVKEITNQIFDAVREIVNKYEGLIERFAGDGVLALFGLPMAHEDDAVRAIRAAQEIHDFVGALRLPYPISIVPRLSMHSGINTDLAVTGNMDLNTGTQGVTGNGINVAARLADLASPGEILVGPNTYWASRNRIRFQPMAPTRLKGKTQPIPIYKVIRVNAPRALPPTDRLVDSELVGRSQELMVLEREILKMIRGRGGVINVVGESGIGKSRLIAELKKRDVMKQTTVLEGKSISMGKNLSFYPVIDLLKQWAKIGEDDSETEAFGKLKAAIQEVHPEETDEILPFVATLMGMKLAGGYAERIRGIEGDALEKLIVKNVRNLVITGTYHQPIVFLMEDFHWADTSSVQLLESMYPIAGKHRLLLINVFRPCYMEDRDTELGILRQRPSATPVNIELHSLKRNESETLIHNMLRKTRLPRAIENQIVEKSGGNPFFIEEIIRSLIDEGVIVHRHDRFEVTDKIHDVIIPNTIKDILVARIDRLEEQTRELIKMASVIGRSFFDRIIRIVAEPIGDLDRRLTYLKDIQLIRDRVRMHELEYSFKHALAQEAAYDSLLLEQRKALHLKVGQAIEEVFGERLHDFYGMLAYHYGKGEDFEKAEEYMIKAGEEALRSSASSEALNFFQEALHVYLKKCGHAADPERVALFEKNIALAFFNKGQYAKAIKYFDSVLESWGVKSSKNRLIRTLGVFRDISVLLKNLYLSPDTQAKQAPDERTTDIFNLSYKRTIALVFLDPERCFAELLKVIRRLNRYGVREIENGFGIWMSASGLFSWSGFSFRISNKILEYVREDIREDQSKELIYYNLFDILYKYFTGNWSNVREYNEKHQDNDLRVGEFWHVSTCILFHGFIKVYRGAFEETREIIAKLNDIGNDYENEDALEYQYSLSIMLYLKTGKYDLARKEVDKALFFILQTERNQVGLYYFGLKAIIQIKLNDMDGAKKTLSQAEEIPGKQEQIPPFYLGSILLANFLLTLSQLQQAIDDEDHSGISKYTRESRKAGKHALKNTKKNASNLSEVCRLMGLHYWLTGRPSKAINWWRKSLSEAQRLESRWDIAMTHVEIAQRVGSVKHLTGALQNINPEEHLQMGSHLLMEMGIPHMIPRIDVGSVGKRIGGPEDSECQQ